MRIGVATSRPNCVSLSPRFALIWMPMIAKIVQTAKQIVKEKVDSHNARLWSAGLIGWVVMLVSVGCLAWSAGEEG